ncbi:glycogen/starch/alpha-glucan phosphorylase [Solemya velesiana gill symbiont]|uniref:Alpha-1,4 glucan phosphorylase n=1 Tax=Solemya velesiana gill symbiont TaxID=1918948 RepID=A0A1T2KYA2_9GAMM|nr:glycogen/starch/alpha-glucan phosphorylase [Solemya velesiana gill symbiont]OOZ37812.1 glycogen phosphorylase [Solemya velesiana gill symbiont]
MSNFDPDTFKHDYLGTEPDDIQLSINNRLVYTIGKDPYTAVAHDWLQALSYITRDRLIERWMETHRSYYRTGAKRVYYLSMEFLIGRSLNNALLNIGFRENCEEALKQLGLDLEELQQLEYDAALGNGGLGRLAACIMDSISTLDLPGTGYGIRYEYGMFRQAIEDGKQIELPENWLAAGNPWEFPRPEVVYKVRFGGQVMEYQAPDGQRRHSWIEGDEVLAMAYDTPIPGFHTETVNNLRLWSAKASHDFDLECFNQGDYIRAVADKTISENLSKVLYPDDRSSENQELRLRQQYFFVSASLQDILRRFLQINSDFQDLPEKIAIQLNDTHPAISIPELMRLLLDEYHLQWRDAWDITTRTFSYTNHTLLPEALESWPVGLLERLLPRHMQIIYEINRRFLLTVTHLHPDDITLLQRMSLIEEEGGKKVRMAHLAIVGSHKVNGVSELHSNLLQEKTFSDFHEFFPDRFINITNGVTPRRWLNEANPILSQLISGAIGSEWIKDLGQLERLQPLADDSEFQQRFLEAKRANKARLADLIMFYMRVTVDPDSLFDVQIKRIHEYKRQMLNVLRIIALYLRICENPDYDAPARTVILAGKSAPGYQMAKLTIRLINDVASIIDSDPAVAGRLKLVFIPNYDVSTACDIIPAAELSQQISTAGMEASGTGNMKLALNGALTMGTLDGANIEIRERVGPENFFTFGLTAEEIQKKRRLGYDPHQVYESDPELKRIIDMIGQGYFSPEEPKRYHTIVDNLLHKGDHFMVLADYHSYMESDAQMCALYRDQKAWAKAAILNTANMSHFSCDRTVQEYAEKVWSIKPPIR